MTSKEVENSASKSLLAASKSKRSPVNLEWRNIRYEVQVGKGKDKKMKPILSNVHGGAKAGR